MKAFRFGLFCALVSIFPSGGPASAFAADTNPPPRLTVELRDGSRVIGTSVEPFLKFHSALLGELKLDVKDIRSVGCVSTNSAKLSTANGDSLTVSFAEPEFAVKTSFGKVALAVDSVRRLTVTAASCPGSHPPGLVALWSGEGDSRDSVGGNTALLTDITFADGKVGQAFSFNGAGSSIRIPASPALDIGAGDGFTVMAWIKPSNLSGRNEVFEWNNGGTWGVHLQMLGPQEFGLGAGNLYACVRGTDGQEHIFWARGGTLRANIFQHVAFSYDKISGIARLFCNGTIVAEQNVGSVTPQTSYDLYLGKPAGDDRSSFSGLIDEASLYNRALSPAEIQMLCREDNGGELPPPPPLPAVTPFNGRLRGGRGE